MCLDGCSSCRKQQVLRQTCKAVLSSQRALSQLSCKLISKVRPPLWSEGCLALCDSQVGPVSSFLVYQQPWNSALCQQPLFFSIFHPTPWTSPLKSIGLLGAANVIPSVCRSGRSRRATWPYLLLLLFWGPDDVFLSLWLSTGPVHLSPLPPSLWG